MARSTSFGAVLLAAGSGSRLRELTEHTHKSMVPVAGSSSIERALTALVNSGIEDIVVVTGYKAEVLEPFISDRFGEKVRTVRNDYWMNDTNIQSAQRGVDSLINPNHGYLLIETDVVAERSCWNYVISASGSKHSIWFTKGFYSPGLTGGALFADDNGEVKEICYAPVFEERFSGWPKLLGILYVAPEQVNSENALRRSMIDNQVDCYYMQVWTDNLTKLPCQAVRLDNFRTATFNDIAALQKAELLFSGNS
ncbi:MAG: sugar phosphate nucleotidyltransferase [Candidatus Nanopelagicales bacterium]